MSFKYLVLTPLVSEQIFLSSDSLKDKLKAILKATYTHSRNLACFVFTYKGLQALQERVQGKSVQSHSFLAACVGGWLVFGDNNNINSQVWSACSPLCNCSRKYIHSIKTFCSSLDQHVLAVQDLVRTVSASGGERIYPPA